MGASYMRTTEAHLRKGIGKNHNFRVYRCGDDNMVVQTVIFPSRLRVSRSYSLDWSLACFFGTARTMRDSTM